MRHSLFGLAASLATFALLAMPASAVVIVVPQANATVPGDANNNFPFNCGLFSLPSMRYQQAYAASDLGGVSGAITQVAFRPDEIFGNPFNTPGIDIEIRFSHTPSLPDSLSTTFSNNIGPDETVVYDGLLTLASSDTGIFDIIIDVADSFIYDGSSNLLMDIWLLNGPFTTTFDAVGSAGTPSVGRVLAYSASDLTGQADGLGLVTQFTIDARGAVIPEPTTLTLLVFGGLGLLRRRRRR